MNLDEVISESRIEVTISMDSKEIALARLADMLYQDGKITSIEGFLNDIDKRETEYCTFIGHETAIPHAISKYAKEASIAFLKVEEGVSYGCVDDQAKLLFMLAIPENSNIEHLRMLSMLATQLMHKSFRDLLVAAHTSSEVYNMLMNRL